MYHVLFLLIPPVFFIIAQLWLAWKSRSRRAPEIEATIEAHARFRAAMSTSKKPRSTIDA